MSDNQPPPVPRPQQPPTTRRGAGRKRAGIVIGTVVALAAIGVTLVLVTKGGDSGGGSDSGGKARPGNEKTLRNDGRNFQLIAPATMAGYDKAPSSAVSGDTLLEKDTASFRRLGVANTRSTGGNYRSRGSDVRELTFAGFWGIVRDPAKLPDAAFPIVARAHDIQGMKAELVGKPQEFAPAGLDDAVLKCQTMKITSADPAKAGVSVTLRACVWADYRTIGVVTVADLGAIVARHDSAVSLSDAADLATRVRGAARVPVVR